MSHKKRPVLLAVLLLKATSGIAQSQPTPPPPDYERVSVPLPRGVTLLAGVRMLFTRDEGPDKTQVTDRPPPRPLRKARPEPRHSRSEKQAHPQSGAGGLADPRGAGRHFEGISVGSGRSGRSFRPVRTPFYFRPLSADSLQIPGQEMQATRNQTCDAGNRRQMH